MTVRGWQAGVDWSGDGDYAGTLEDVSSYINKSPVTVTWGRPTDTLETGTPAAEMNFELRNRDRSWSRWFSPENALSPITGKIAPGKLCRFTKTVRGGAQAYLQTAFTTPALGGWTTVGGGTLTRVASPSEDGDGALNYVPPGAVATVGVVNGSFIDITTMPAGWFLVYFRVRATAAFANAVAAIDWYDVGGNLLSSSTSGTVALASATWTTVDSGYLSPPATATKLKLRLQLGGTPPNTTTFNVDVASVWAQPYDADQTYKLFEGPLDDFSVDPNAAAKTFSGKALDGWSNGEADESGSASTLSTLVWSGIRTGDAIRIVLLDSGWTGPTSIDPGATVIPWWWEEGTDPGEAIDKLVKAEGQPAIAYVEGGMFVFRDRHHRIRSTASRTSKGVFTHLLPGSVNATGRDFKIEKNTFQYDHGLKSIVNTATFSVEVRRLAEVQQVYLSEDPIALSTGETATIFAEPDNPVVNLRGPSTDNGDMVADTGAFTATVDRSSGKKFIITITCVTTGVLSQLALRGNPIVVSRTVQVSSSEPGSIGRYRKRAWPGDLPWANRYDAQAICDRIVSSNSEYRPRVSFTLVNFNDRYSSMMLGLRISDRITVINEEIGVNGDFYIERLEHRVDRLQVHRVTVSCIAADLATPTLPFMFGVSGQGFNQGAFTAAGTDNPDTMFVFDQSGQGFAQGQFAN